MQLYNWEVYPLPMNNLSDVNFSENQFAEKSGFYKGYIDIDEPCDTFLKLENFKKGFVSINGSFSKASSILPSPHAQQLMEPPCVWNCSSVSSE